jgi:tetratricopeptide (TPR) repeat protein
MLVLSAARAQPPVPPDLDATDPLVRARIHDRLDAVDADPTVASWLALAEAYDAHAYMNEAVACYRHVLELTPRDARAWYLLGIVLADLGRTDEAIDALAEASSINPTYAPAHWRRGYWLLGDGHVDDAEREFDAAAETEPGRLGLARVALARRDPATARALIAPFIQRSDNRNFAYAHQLMAGVLRLEGENESAGVSMAIGAGAGPVWTDPWLREIILQETGYDAIMDRIADLTSDGDNARAIEVINDALQTWPDDIGLLNYLGYALVLDRQRDKAVEIWNAALQRDPDNYLLHLNLGSVFAEDAIRGEHDLADVLDHLDRAIEANPTGARAHEVRGTLMNALGRHDEALVSLDRAFDLAPTNALLARQLTELCMSRADWPGAERALQRWTRLQPQSPEAHLRHALVLSHLDRPDDADRALDRAAALLGVNHPQVRAVRIEIEGRRR